MRQSLARLGPSAALALLVATPTLAVSASSPAPAASPVSPAVAHPVASSAPDVAAGSAYGVLRLGPSRADGLDDPVKKEIAMEIVSSNENSSLDWRAQYKYIEDIHDGRGYTGGIIGFCSGTGDMLELVEAYTDTEPDNPLAPFLKALRKVNGTDSHKGLGKP